MRKEYDNHKIDRGQFSHVEGSEEDKQRETMKENGRYVNVFMPLIILMCQIF